MHGKTKGRKGKVKVGHLWGKSQDRGKGIDRVRSERETLEVLETMTQCRG